MSKTKSLVPRKDPLKKSGISRRDFLKNVGLAGLGVGAAAAMTKISLPPAPVEAAFTPVDDPAPAVANILTVTTGAVKTASQTQTQFTKPYAGAMPTNEERQAAATAARTARAQQKASGMLPNATLLPTPGGTPDIFGVYPNYAHSQLPEIDGSGNVIAGTGIRKFVDGLPGLGSANANNLGQFIPLATPDTLTYPGCDYYEIAVVQYQEQTHSDIPATTLRGYVQTNYGTSGAANTVAPDPVHYLGTTIVATANRPVRVKMTNLLPLMSDPIHIYLPVDATIMGGGPGPSGGNYTDNRATMHLHGGRTPWISDGTPHQWTAPNIDPTIYAKGASTKDVSDMPVSPGGTMTFYYTNQQTARLMFYHDHVVGITRLNVYMGIAAPYLLTDPVEQAMITGGAALPGTTTPIVPAGGILPGLGIPLVFQDRTYVPDNTRSYTSAWGTFSSQLNAEDPTWDPVHWGGQGNLWYPHVWISNENPYSITSGLTPFGRWDYGPWVGAAVVWVNGPVNNPFYINGGDEPPLMPGCPQPTIVAEAFHDTPIVNGTPYPTLTVQPQAYRFRILNAADDRMFNLSIYQAAPLTIGVTAPGTGYTSLPTVNINGGSVTGATATASLGVVSYTMTNIGAGYSSPPNVVIKSSNGTGSGATAAAVLSAAGTITSIMVLTAGAGYTAAPTVSIGKFDLTGGVQATATAVLGVTRVTVAGGTASTGPIINPTISFTGGGGSGAAAVGSVLSEVPMVPAQPNPALPFPSTWLASNGGNFPPDILDGRPSGVPDPRSIGPSWIVIGNDGGFIPGPVVLDPSPIGYDHANIDARFNDIVEHCLIAAPAERWDVVVDFSAFAGQTLIVYNDAPAPAPLGDWRNDPYTGDPDQTPGGGPKATLAGYGPNIRTVMQIRVAAATPVPYDATQLDTFLPLAYKLTQPPPLAPSAVYNLALGTTYPTDLVRPLDTMFSPAAAPTTVASIVVVNRGVLYYTSVPTVTLSGGGGTGAAATAVIQPQGAIDSFVVGNPGSGYSSEPTVAITGGGGTGAAGRALIVGGMLLRIDVISSGSGYTTNPTVTLSGGGGSGAQAAAILSTSFQITSPGTSYTLVPTVALSAGGGTGATAVASLGIGSVTLATTGTYPSYTTPPTITVTGGGGTGALLVPAMAANPIPGTLGAGFAVASIGITCPGSGYTTPPTITFSGGGTGSVQATATALLGVSYIRVTAAGTGYTTPPTVTITAATGDITGTGATALAVNASLTTGRIGDISITNGGASYTTAPQVALIGGGSTQTATCYATLTGTPTYFMKPMFVSAMGFERYYGRLTSQLGTPGAYYYVDPVTEFWYDNVTVGPPVAGDGTQFWRFGMLGIDTHPLHFHLFDLQIICRITVDNMIIPPDPEERGWKETIRINPAMDLVVAARPIAPQTPFGLPDSIRPYSPTEAIGATMSFTNALPVGGATSITNQLANFGEEYVWHCHILAHEENDMMRPVTFTRTVNVPATPMGLAVSGTGGGAHLSWTDPTPAATAMGNAQNEVGFNIYSATGTTGTFAVGTVPTFVVPANTTSFIDGTVTSGSHHYAISAFNRAGVSAISASVPLATTTALALPTVPSLTSPAAAASVSVYPFVPFVWAASTGATSYTLQVLSGATVVVNMPGLAGTNLNLPYSAIVPGSYTWKVSATGPRGTTAYATARAITLTARPTTPAPLAPVLSAPANGSRVSPMFAVNLTWAASANTTSYGLQVTASGAGSPLINVTGITPTGYVITLGTLTNNTTYSWQVNATGPGGTSAYSAPFTFRFSAAMVVADFDGDGKTDVGVFTPSTRAWNILPSSGALGLSYVWGAAGDIPVIGDYDGDGKADIGVFTPSTGAWNIKLSGGGGKSQNWGASGDIPIFGDFDGDGKTDIGVYRPSTNSWYILPSSGAAPLSYNWGAAGDIPVIGDYDGDGKADIGVFTPSTGAWNIKLSGGGGKSQNWGASGDIPIFGDFDGDGKTDIGVYRPSTNSWYILPSSGAAPLSYNWGAAGDIPVAGDYDGDGKTDIGIFRPSTNSWYILLSGGGSKSQGWGATGDTPLPSLIQ